MALWMWGFDHLRGSGLAAALLSYNVGFDDGSDAKPES